MLFNSATYLLFLTIVVVVYWQLPQRGRLWLIFAASCVFYGFWRIEFIPLLLFSAALDYGLALWIDRTEEPDRRRSLMIASIVINLGILIFFKYLLFFKDAVWSAASWLGYHPGAIELKIILPLGISFYIFATISYVIDVYRREYKAERDFLLYCCFVVYFPHLVAGPILRARSLIPQLLRPADFSIDLVSSGVARILAGLFLKVCLADPIGSALVDPDFQRPVSSLSALDAWTLAFLFGYQIYFDFAGYSHIAIGSSKLLGITLPENFDFPYMATSPREFWRRWHISLSTWIRDYLYLPMAGGYQPTVQRSSQSGFAAPAPGLPEMRSQRTTSLYLTWALMGLWHGANWTFVVWGLYHAACVHAQRVLRPVSDKVATGLQGMLGWMITLPLMMAAWVPFRCQSLTQAAGMWKRMLDPTGYLKLTLILDRYVTAAGVLAMIVAAYAVRERVLPYLAQRPALQFGASVGYYAVAFAFVIVFLQVRGQFIYFQF